MANRAKWAVSLSLGLVVIAACGESEAPNDDVDAGIPSPDMDGATGDGDAATLTDASDGGEFVDGDHELVIVEVTKGLEHPWALAFLPNGDILVTERAGRLRVVRDDQLLGDPVSGTPSVVAEGQGGLLDLALAPDFASSRLVYMSYSKAVPGGSTTAVARARLENDALAGLEDVFVSNAVGGTRHYGSRIAFDGEGHLYVTVGDRGVMERAQDLTDQAGSVIRILPGGGVPSDNPYAGRVDVDVKIFSHGHRNAQGLAVNPWTGEVWLNEHGPRGGDEINIVRAGANYGWPLTTHGIDYDGTPISPNQELPGIESPLLHWTPSIAPSGMVIYGGDHFPHYRGNVFVGALAGKHLRRVVLRDGMPVRQELLLEERGERIRDVREGPDGQLYVLTDENDGALLRIARLDP